MLGPQRVCPPVWLAREKLLDPIPDLFPALPTSNVKLPTDVRCSMLVALGDLGRRHPNVVEPWTVRMFECLRDEPGEEGERNWQPRC